MTGPAAEPTEWENDTLDLAAYLARTGYDGALEPTAEVLTALHRAHATALTFENLDLALGRGIGVDLGSVQHKLVGRRRGGYCLEHNLLFAAVLERIGFRVDRLLTRIGYDPRRPRPRTHMALRVFAGEERWLADVGVGIGLLEPLRWAEGGSGRVGQGVWAYELLTGDGHVWQVRERQPEGWQTIYSFTEEPQHASDIAMASHFSSTHPNSPFVKQLIAIRSGDDLRHRLMGRRFARLGPEGPVEERELTDTEVVAVLREEFRLPVRPEEIPVLMAGLPPRTD